MNLRSMARALGGEVVGQEVLCPGPGHSPKDRSLSVKLDVNSPDLFIVHSFADDDFRACRDYVRDRLGLPSDYGRTSRRREEGEISPPSRSSATSADNTARALALWQEARP